MKKVSNLSVILGLSLLATATGANAETQNPVQVQPQSTSVPVMQSSLPATEVKLSESETIRAINSESIRPKTLAQNVTSVSQLSDVKPTDWAFTALQSLVERYGCIAGYPDSTFRGRQATSRYEFAAGLNACLDKINEIISAGLADKVSKEDLATLQKLQEEFAAELATLRGRVDALDAKVAKLEAQQFSTTTKLSGLAFFNVTTGSGSGVLRDGATPGNAPNTTMSGLVWLTLNTSFTGKDSLITQLAVGNGNSAYSNAYGSSGFFNTTATTFTDQTAGATANTFVLRELSYTFPVFEKASLVVGPRVNFYKYFDGNRFLYPWNTTFSSINSSLLSDAKRGAGAVFMTPLGDMFDFKVGYLAESNEFFTTNSAASPTQGLTGGTNNITAELGFKPSDSFKLRLLYGYGNIAGNRNAAGALTGTVGGSPSLQATTIAGFNNGQSNVFVANFDWLVTKGFGLFGRYGYGTTNLNRTAGGSTNVNQYTFQIGAAFPDLFKEGAQAMISFAVPYKFGDTDNVLASGRGNDGTQYDLEFSYIYPVTKNISLVPSAYFIFNPNNFSGNPTVFIGNLQAVFSF
ncbi:iron uptake porin [Phormidium tenue]|uniref:Carbohydrate porin n=1 Tax=Phormidium tenue FACHB-1050 TaxID=2692857 RepID=A0ABR8C4Z1_9CYAN|nr:iron uptake porin [Phormidium tenue]MBD2315475.1 carbohydrate porin [Phormidium tenue FACHB-1050]